MSEEVPSIGPSVDLVLKRSLILKEHVDAVMDVRSRAVRAWEEMLGREVRLMIFDGFSPRLAEQAAVNNLALRRLELHLELEDVLTRMQEELRQKMVRLAEEMEDLGEQ